MNTSPTPVQSGGPFGALPSHWKVMKLKHLASVQLSNVDKKCVDGETPVRLCNYVDVYKHDFITSRIDFMEATASKGQIDNFSLRVGDVLITKDSEDWQDIAVPAVVAEDLDGVLCGYHLAHIRPEPGTVVGRFLMRAFVANGIADQFRLMANGVTRYGIGKDDLGAALFPVPPFEEQRAIADFLDRKCAQIDSVIAKKQHMIGLLQEKGKSLVSEAVTTGINPGVPTKNSGVPWLGNVPSHWTGTKLKRMFRFVKRRGHPTLTVLSVYREYGVIEKAGRGDNHNRTPDDLSVYQLVDPGDLVVNKMKAWQGSLGVSQHRGITSPDYAVFAPSHREHHSFLHYALRDRRMADVYRSISTGIRPDQWRIEPEEFLDLPLYMPPIAEQVAICRHIETELARLDRMSLLLERMIQRLGEYRQALITAAVTGQINMATGARVDLPLESTKPAAKPNPYFRRTVLAAEIIDKLCAEPTFGHVKFQKCLFIAQHHLHLADFEENYKRAAAGPYDSQMIRSVESQLQKQKWFRVQQTGDRYVYKRMDRAGDHKKYFEGYFGDKADQLNSLIELLKPLDTDRAEIVATLYAVWNDFLLLNETFDDDRIVQEVLTNWDESKKRFPEDRWKKALVWMREKGLVPTGFGKPTVTNPAKGTRGKE